MWLHYIVISIGCIRDEIISRKAKENVVMYLERDLGVLAYVIKAYNHHYSYRYTLTGKYTRGRLFFSGYIMLFTYRRGNDVVIVARVLV